MTARDDDVRRWILAGLIDATTGDRTRLRGGESRRETEPLGPSNSAELFIYVAAAMIAAGVAVFATALRMRHLPASAEPIVRPGDQLDHLLFIQHGTIVPWQYPTRS